MDNSVLGAAPISHHHMHYMHSVTSSAMALEAQRAVGSKSKGGLDVLSKGVSVNCSKGNGVSDSIATANTATSVGNHNNASDDDEQREDGNDVNLNSGNRKKGSPWQRMKWTDEMVRLLITVVSLVGDDGIADGPASTGPKRNSGPLPKKRKWKTVSKIMMEGGCYVSPQQCEDKFNDLNKRYKRLNKILGWGTSCQVVENPVLLGSMNHLSAKMKENVRKILSSKHLFYREMCAYHTEQRRRQAHDLKLRGCSLPVSQFSNDGNRFQEEYDEENEEHGDDGENIDDDEDIERIASFEKRKMDDFCLESTSSHDKFGADMAGLIQDTTNRSPLELQEWINNRVLQLQERRVTVQVQAFELEKRRIEWQRLCSKKDKELERLRLENGRVRIENEKMALQVKKKEMEIYFKRSGALRNPTSGRDRTQVRDQIDLGRVP